MEELGKNLPKIDKGLKMQEQDVLGQSEQPQSYNVPPPIAITQNNGRS